MTWHPTAGIMAAPRMRQSALNDENGGYRGTARSDGLVAQ
jgi:hypothetical protein